LEPDASSMASWGLQDPAHRGLPDFHPDWMDGESI